ncbi:class I SAM-dependent methyltransferase [bacterium]|nr:class I SAM-dependent methyltransferase [bacterium]
MGSEPARRSTSAAAQQERHASERHFHDEWARSIDPDSVVPSQNFAPETAIENRYILSQIGPLTDQRLLDIGCGSGEAAVYFAQQGARVTAMDLSGAFLQVAQRVALRHEAPISLAVGAGEHLPFADDSFDVVYGHGVLHHLELLPAMREVSRILRPGGRAYFIEPLGYNPVIDVYRWMAGNMRTPSERPLRFTDIDALRPFFRRVAHREFWLTTQLVFVWFLVGMGVHPARERYWKKVLYDVDRIRWLFRPLYRVERWTLRRFPWFGRYAWNSVICLEK